MYIKLFGFELLCLQRKVCKNEKFIKSASCFFPQDYYNFSKTPNKFYLPPLSHSTSYPSFHIEPSPSGDREARDSKEFKVPKTFTTRKGALLLFSEDLAQRNMEREAAAAAKKKASSQSQALSLTPASSVDAQVMKL